MPDPLPLQSRWLGRVQYKEALALQESIVSDRILALKNNSPSSENRDVLLLLEHEPVYTMGRTPDQSSLRIQEELPHPVIRINRGGQATYHGPGQLIGYPILDLTPQGRDLHQYLRILEEIVIEVLLGYNITGQRLEGLTGVWVGKKKIASIGIGVRHWITMHGFALNVCGDLSPFQNITPCGIANLEMTSIEAESERAVSVKEVAEHLPALFFKHINLNPSGAHSI